jgi:hypothetical protein
MATYQDDSVVRVMLAEIPGAEASQEEVGAALRELLSANFPGITEEQVGRCLMKGLCEAARREKEAETLAPSFAEALAKIPGSPGVPNVETLRELIEAFLYAHQGRAPNDADELVEWIDQEHRSGRLRLEPIH